MRRLTEPEVGGRPCPHCPLPPDGERLGGGIARRRCSSCSGSGRKGVMQVASSPGAGAKVLHSISSQVDSWRQLEAEGDDVLSRAEDRLREVEARVARLRALAEAAAACLSGRIRRLAKDGGWATAGGGQDRN